MEKFRIGNDLTVFWAILDDDSQPYDLSGRTVKIFLTHPRGRMEITQDVNIQGNVISWLFRGRQQRYLGVYKLTVEIFSSPTTRVLRRDIDQAFSLVSATLYVEESNGRPEINETGKLTLSTILEVYQIMPIVPNVGPNGNWWVDGVDTGKPSTGMSAYEFAKENGYTGTEEEYAAECAAVPTLNEESRVATAAASEAADNADRAAGEASRSATVANSASATATNAAVAANTAAEAAKTAAELSIDQIEAVGQYIGNEVSPAAEAAKQAATKAINAAEAANNAAGSINGATDNANTAAEAANAAATRAERAIEEFGPAIANKADLENGKIIASQLPDYILGQVMFGGLIYPDGTISPSANFIAKYGNDTNISASEASKYNGVYFIVTGEVVDMILAGVSQVSTGDWIISVGNSWKKVDNSDAVTSVAGLVGNVYASSLAAALSDITDSNSLARKTDLPKKLSELENDIEIGGGGGSYDDSEIKEILSEIVDEEGYLYSNGEKVDMRFTRSLLPVGTSIPANANLNTIEFLKIGKYYCSQNVNAKTVKNCPVNMAFSMEVFNPLGTSVDDETTADYTYRLRVLTPYDTGIHYTQCCRTSGTPGEWTYDSWYVTPRSKFALASSKNDGSAAIGATNKGVYIDSNGEIKAMSYTIAKSVPSNAVFTDTNTKVTAVENHYTPAEDDAEQITAPEGEVVTGIKRDAAGHVVGVISTIQEVGETEYESAIADKELTTPSAVGGIAQGTKVSDLEGKTFAEMFDDLLFPTVNPTFTAPSASIAFKSYSSTQEIGAAGPTSANFTTGYNAGAITLNGTKQADRGGSHNTESSFIYVNGSASNKTLPSTVALGSTTFKYRAAYGEGPQPKNNKGGNYDSPLEAGTVDSSQITLNGTYPWYATTATAGTLTKQSLIAWNATAGKMSTSSNGFEVKPHTAAAPQMFKIPRQVSSIQIYNSFAGKWESDKVSNWDESTSSETINGNTRTYYTYTYNGDARGAVKLIVKF